MCTMTAANTTSAQPMEGINCAPTSARAPVETGTMPVVVHVPTPVKNANDTPGHDAGVLSPTPVKASGAEVRQHAVEPGEQNRMITR